MRKYKILPFGDRILCKRRKVGEKIGNLYVSDKMKDAPTDLADVVGIPEFTQGDKQIIDNTEKIVNSLTTKATEGDSEAMIALLRLNEFLKIKSVRIGDVIMVGKYVGVDFMDNQLKEELTLVNGNDIIGLAVQDE